jgi:hypothetical protein
MTLKELKKENTTAHDALIDMWSELSRCSLTTARRYLVADIGGRFSLGKSPDGVFVFHDSEAVDTWKYSKSLKDWTWLLNVG